jgi:hypothetical protein
MEVKEGARQLILTASGNAPSLPRSDWIDPPGTNSSKIFSESSSRTVPMYRCSNHPDRSNNITEKNITEKKSKTCRMQRNVYSQQCWGARGS